MEKKLKEAEKVGKEEGWGGWGGEGLGAGWRGFGGEGGGSVGGVLLQRLKEAEEEIMDLRTGNREAQLESRKMSAQMAEVRAYANKVAAPNVGMTPGAWQLEW